MFSFLKNGKSEKGMSANFLFDEIKTIIGREDFFKGDITSSNFLRIDGDFLGSINSTKRVIIGEEGRVKSNINSNELVVSGIVFGNVHVKRKIKIFASGCIIGNISCKSIEVEEGAIIDGYMNVGTGNLDLYEKNMFFYTGSYKIDEDILKEVNKGIEEQKESKKVSFNNENKYLYDYMSKANEDK